LPEYVGHARAQQAWVAWHEGDLRQARAHAEAAIDLWQQRSIANPGAWTAHWPLIAVALAEERLAEAIASVPILLDPSQARMPDALVARLEAALEAWDGGRSEATCTGLQEAMRLAQKIGWF
jgi:hypothetical protein